MGRCFYAIFCPVYDWFFHPSGFHPWRWRLLTLWVVVFTLLVSWSVNQNSQARHDLCQSKKNAIAQIDSQKQYLEDVRLGLRYPIKGVTINDIKLGIARQQVYVDSVHSC